MTMRFFHARDCTAHIVSYLAGAMPDAPATHALAEQLTADCELNEEELLADSSFDLIVGRWAIRDEQLDILKCLRDAVVAMAPVNFFLNAPTTAAVTAVVAAVVGLVRNAFRYGVRLTPSQLLAVAMLRACGPLSPAEIASKINETADVQNNTFKPFSSEDVVALLTTLKEAMTRNGRVAFVEVASDGRWNLRGV